MSYNINHSPDPLLRTKLFRPATKSGLVSRPQLIGRLNTALGEGPQNASVRLILVCAPAGFGKTTLVSSWLAQTTGYQPAWLSLDEADNDLGRFLTYLIAALQIADTSEDEAASRVLQSLQPTRTDAILTSLINEVNQNDRPIILVLEDYHTISAEPVHRALTYLVDHLSTKMHLLIITRSDPPLPLSRLRARGQLLEIRANDMRFSLEESRRFFGQVIGLALAEEDLAALTQRAEGWVAGLQLAALSMQGRDDPHAFIADFTGSNRYILDYLTDEVLDKRPQGTREFLLQTSILDRLCGPLCDAVTGRSDGQDTLELLEKANLFLIPLDQQRRWYRYHHLFAEVLRRRLHKEQPSNLDALHRRAREWLEQNGLLREAVGHALAGLDYEVAVRLIESKAETMLHTGASESLAKWLDSLPQEMIHTRARLALARGWTYQWGPGLDLERAEEWAQLALGAATSRSPEPHLAGEVAALQAMITASRGQMDRSREHSRLALENLPQDSPWRCAIVFSLATTHFDAGDMIAATNQFEEALRLSQRFGVLYIQLAAASFLADLQVIQGHIGRAKDLYEQVLSWTVPEFPLKGGIMARAGLAHILCERNQLDAALTHVYTGAAKLDQVGGAWAAFVLYRVQARAYQAQEKWEEAAETLRRMIELGQETQVDLVEKLAAASHAHLHLAQGNLVAANQWALNCGLDAAGAEADKPGWHEAEYLTLARVLAARGEHAVARSLAERLLEAAEREGRYGSVISIQILLSLIYQKMYDEAAALTSLKHALFLAEPEGYLRIFLDEGEPMARLLRLALQKGVSSSYVFELLRAFSTESYTGAAALMPEHLSARELEVLRLVATGASNQDIADQLVIALSTVKKHMGNILVKLDTSSRTEAVARARELHLLP